MNKPITIEELDERIYYLEPLRHLFEVNVQLKILKEWKADIIAREGMLKETVKELIKEVEGFRGTWKRANVVIKIKEIFGEKLTGEVSK